MKVVATNKKAYHDYQILDTYEAGIRLVGCEVKSARKGEINLKDSFALIAAGEVILKNVYIKPYDKGSFSNVDPLRDRKLLLHKQEIMRLIGKVQEKGLALIPVKMYFEKSLLKVELALAKGKHTYDKRDSIAQKDMERYREREISDYQKYGK